MFNQEKIDDIRNRLVTRSEKLSVAESVTAGLLQAAFASAETALKFFEGGITTYNIHQKVKHLQIDKANAAASNCVSEQTATEMAHGVCRLFGTDWGIGITGYATRVPESDFKLFAYFSIVFKGALMESHRLELNNEQPEEAQLKYVDEITKHFLTLLDRDHA